MSRLRLRMWLNFSHFRHSELIIISDWMSSNEGHNNIRIPPPSPLPSLLPRLQSWERKENVIWKWENNYLIITFNTEASITACTVSALQYIIQYRATKIRSARVRRRGSKLLMTWYLPEIITIFFHRLKFFSKPIHWLSNSQSVSPPPLCKIWLYRLSSLLFSLQKGIRSY